MPESKTNIIAEIPWNDGTDDKLYVSYDTNEKSQVINITSDYFTGSGSRSLVVTIQTNTPNVEPSNQQRFQLSVTQTVDDTSVVATFNDQKSLYSGISSQYPKES